MIQPIYDPRRMFCKLLTIPQYKTHLLNVTKVLVGIFNLCRTIIFLQCFNKFFPIKQSSLRIYPREEIKRIPVQMHRRIVNFIFLVSLIVAKLFFCFQNPPSRIISFKYGEFHLCVWLLKRSFWPRWTINVFFLILPYRLSFITVSLIGFFLLSVTSLGLQCCNICNQK